jgi:hypothetical protein
MIEPVTKHSNTPLTNTVLLLDLQQSTVSLAEGCYMRTVHQSRSLVITTTV